MVQNFIYCSNGNNSSFTNNTLSGIGSGIYCNNASQSSFQMNDISLISRWNGAIVNNCDNCSISQINLDSLNSNQ